MGGENDRGAVLITGASTGIGRSTARRLDGLGFRVFAGVRRDEDARTLRDEATDRLTPVHLDVTDERAIADAARAVEEQTSGALFGLVNNAGLGLGGPLEMLPVADIRRLMEVNLTGVLAVTGAFLPMLRRARGRIVNIGSVAGVIAFPGASAYSASKFGLQAVTDSLRVELRPFGVHATIILPGRVESALWEKGRVQREALLEQAPAELRGLYAPLLALGRRMQERPRGVTSAETVAGTVARALTDRRPRPRYLVGAHARRAARLGRLPRGLREWLMGKAIALAARRCARGEMGE
jgi:NAD(P)-dependent dehydrogenase (short-subunit alcohol dehydrogenase family)